MYSTHKVGSFKVVCKCSNCVYFVRCFDYWKCSNCVCFVRCFDYWKCSNHGSSFFFLRIVMYILMAKM